MCIQEPLLILKKLIVLFHTLSAYNSLLVRYKVYSSDPRECLCTSLQILSYLLSAELVTISSDFVF